jgi:hypothetical protein
MSTALVPYNEMEKMAVAVAKSGLFGMKTPEQALALMLLAQAEGLHPAIAARDYHVIQGRPALKADAMLARFQQAGGKVTWNAYTDTEVSGTFSHPQGGSIIVAWTLAQAKAAGLTGKDVWKQYPRAMLRARVISEGIRTVYPGVSVGAYTPEEIEDFNAKPPVREVKAEVEPAPAPVVQAPAPVAPSPVKELTPADRIKASGWSKQQLGEYSRRAFQVAAAKDLSPEQLAMLASVASGQTYEIAIAELDVQQNFDDIKL